MLDLNSTAVVVGRLVQCFPARAPQSVFPVISYNILLFRGTPQQLQELFGAVLGGKPGV